MEPALEICMKHLVHDHKFIVSLGTVNTYYQRHELVAHVKKCRAQATKDLLASVGRSEALDAIRRGADINAPNVLHRAIMCGYVDKILLHEDFVTDMANELGTLSEDDPHGVTPLQAAFACDDPGIFEDLIEYGADPDVQLTCGCRIIHHTVRIPQDTSFLRTLIEYDAELDYTDSRGNTPLHVAVMHNCMDAVSMLVRDGADPDIANDESETPFYTAMLQGNVEMVDHLLHLQIVPDRDVLKAVVDFGELEMMELILQYTTLGDDVLLFLIEYAAKQGQHPLVHLLNEYM
jgi:ankyrin repeat protein